MASKIPEKDPLTTGDVARVCGVTVPGVVKWIKRGMLQAYRTPGGHYRVQREDLVRFLRDTGHPAAAVERGSSRILVVDEDPANVEAYTRALRKLGPEVEVMGAGDGVTGLIMLGSWKPDVLVLDLRMRGLDGIDVVRRLGQLPELRTRVIVLSSYLTPAIAEDLQSLGVFGCLDKPADPGKLAALAEEALGITIAAGRSN